MGRRLAESKTNEHSHMDRMEIKDDEGRLKIMVSACHHGNTACRVRMGDNRRRRVAKDSSRCMF